MISSSHLATEYEQRRVALARKRAIRVGSAQRDGVMARTREQQRAGEVIATPLLVLAHVNPHDARLELITDKRP